MACPVSGRSDCAFSAAEPRPEGCGTPHKTSVVGGRCGAGGGAASSFHPHHPP